MGLLIFGQMCLILNSLCLKFSYVQYLNNSKYRIFSPIMQISFQLVYERGEQKGVLKGKLIAGSWILCVHIKTSSHWAKFVNKNRCISVRLVSEEVKALNLITLIIHIIVSYDQNISLIFYVKDGSHVRLRHPSCVCITALRQYCSTKDVYTSETTFLALHPWGRAT